MQILGEFITNNKSTIDKLIKVGEISSTLVYRFEIWSYFNRLSADIPKMDRYEICAKHFKVTDRNVRKALQIMSKKVF